MVYRINSLLARWHCHSDRAAFRRVAIPGSLIASGDRITIGLHQFIGIQKIVEPAFIVRLHHCQAGAPSALSHDKAGNMGVDGEG